MAVHCYAACRAGFAAPPGPGVDGAAVGLIEHGPVAVLASIVDDAGVDRAGLAAHARVVQQAFESGVVLPLRFPSIAESEEHVVDGFLRPHRASLVEGLDRVDGCEEARVQVSYDSDAAVAEVVSRDPSLQALRGRPAAALELGERIVAALRQQAALDAADVVAAVEDLVVDAAVEATGGERVVLAASLLVPTGATARVRDEAERWATTRPPARVRVVGPLPAYSFAQLAGAS